MSNTLKLVAIARDERGEIRRCLSYVLPLVCHTVYRDCENPGSLPTGGYCLNVKNGVCKNFWTLALRLLDESKSKDIGRCLALPNCEKDFPLRSDLAPQHWISKLPGEIN